MEPLPGRTPRCSLEGAPRRQGHAQRLRRWCPGSSSATTPRSIVSYGDLRMNPRLRAGCSSILPPVLVEAPADRAPALAIWTSPRTSIRALREQLRGRAGCVLRRLPCRRELPRAALRGSLSTTNDSRASRPERRAVPGRATAIGSRSSSTGGVTSCGGRTRGRCEAADLTHRRRPHCEVIEYALALRARRRRQPDGRQDAAQVAPRRIARRRRPSIPSCARCSSRTTARASPRSTRDPAGRIPDAPFISF